MRRLVQWAGRIGRAGAILVLPVAAAAEPAAEPFTWPVPAWMAPPPVPADNPMTAQKVELGRHLFYDARLSADGTVACVSCHVQDRAFTDGREVPVGINGSLGIRNAPGLANTGYLPLLTWANPHMTSLEFQALMPLFGDNPDEMGNNGQEAALFARLAADPYYQQAFPAAFPDRPAPDLFTLTRALAAFQRSLISVNSAYDRFKYWGEADALSPAAKRGEQLFFDHRFECYHCHSGIHMTDNLQTNRSGFAETGFHNTGLYNIDGSGAYPLPNIGMMELTGDPADMGKFRTPSLRNVAVTGPYFHDGSAETLKDVLDHYRAGGRQITTGPNAGNGAQSPLRDGMIVGITATEAEIADIIAFLESLTDPEFLADPAFADPWPADHPATAQRMLP
jgi:cytochrome c peroxidase